MREVNTDFTRKNLRGIRKDSGLSAKELGDKIGFPYLRIKNYEMGYCMPPIDYLLKISEFSSISINDILSEEVYKEDAVFFNSKRPYTKRSPKK